MTSTNPSSEVSPDYLRGYRAKVLEARVFGAFVSAIQYRKENNGLTQKALAEMTGKDETGISKLLSGPANWQLRKISDLAGALNLDFEFALVDRADRCRVFLDTGVRELVFSSQWLEARVARPTYTHIDNVLNALRPQTEGQPWFVPPFPLGAEDKNAQLRMLNTVGLGYSAAEVEADDQRGA